jgi:hypothetical protein
VTFNARTALPQAVLLLALAARCGGDRPGLTVTVVAGGDVPRPTTLAVSWLSARGTIFQREKIAVSAGENLASIFVELDGSDTSDRRVLVRGMGPGAATSIGALRIMAAAAGRTEVLTLHATMPDADSDGIPDVIDDCRACADAGADAVTGDDAQVTPYPDAAPEPDADTPDAGAPIPDATLPDRAPPPPVDASAPPPTISGLVGLWRMDDGTGTTARDSSLTGNPGTLMRPTGGDWGVGHHGAALELTGTSWVSVPSHKAYDATGGLTLSAWVFWSKASPAGQVIMARQRGVALQNAFWLGLDNNRLHFSVEDDGVNITLPAGRWVHVAGTYDGTKVALFVDGGLVIAAAVSARATTANRGVSIGADINGADPHSATSMFVGKLDEVAIFDRALTPAEVAMLAK